MMALVNEAKPLTLDGQYIAAGNIENIRMNFLDLMNKHLFTCKEKSYPHLIGPGNEFIHLCLIDFSWGECGEMEFIDLDGFQILVRFYTPDRLGLAEIEEYELKLRQSFSRPRIELWFYENMGWTAKVIEVFVEELYEQRLACLRNFQKHAVSRLGLIPYPLSYLQIRPAPQIGISQIQQDCLRPQAGIFQIQPDSTRPQAGISQQQAETPRRQGRVGRDIPREHPAEESDVFLTRENQELLRLWTNGLTAKEIGKRTGKTGKTITNRISVLRSRYGEDRVPLRKEPNQKSLG
jgi:hypothetical protein